MEFSSVIKTIGMVAFIVFFFGFCIFIHEFGHMLVGLWCGLRVEKFSIGFGKRLWGFTWRGIEFAVSLLPFGGYVALPQIDVAEEPKGKDGKVLPYAKPLARAATAFAGPFFNVLFGFFLATVMWGVGLWVSAPSTSVVVTSIPQSLPIYEKDSVHLDDRIVAFDGKETNLFLEEICLDLPADGQEHQVTVLRGEETLTVPFVPRANPEWAAGLRKGDRIVKVNGKRFTNGNEQMRELYVYNENAEVELEVVRGTETLTFRYVAEPNPLWEDLGMPFFHYANPVTIGAVSEGSTAATAGLKPGDQLLQFNGENLFDSIDFLEKLDGSQGVPFTLLIGRNEKEFRTEPLRFAGSRKEFGISFSVVASSVLTDMPAYQAGLRDGDIITQLNGEMVLGSKDLMQKIRGSKGEPISLTFFRSQKEYTIENLRPMEVDDELEGKIYLVGMRLSEQQPKVIGHPSPWKQFTRICTQTGKTLKLLFVPVTSKITGKARGKTSIRLQNMSGPAGIITMLWFSLKSEGLRGGLGLIILITFSLALVNLLPLPVLDGGHILFAFIELLIRRPLPRKFVSVLQNVFAVLLIAFFLYVTFFDGKRIFKYAKTAKSVQKK